MNSSRSSPIGDLILHGILFLAQMVLLISYGLTASGTTPPFVYPCFLILAVLTLYRQNEAISRYGTRLILVPGLLSIFFYGFCLLNELGNFFWAYYAPRWYSIPVRILWMQTGLLLIHPLIFPYVLDWVTRVFRSLADRGYFGKKLFVTVPVVVILLWLLRSRNISSDGYAWLRYSFMPDQWYRYLREPLGVMIFYLWIHGVMNLFHWFSGVGNTIVYLFCGAQSDFPWENLQAYVGIVILNIGCGCLAVGLLTPVIRETASKPFSGLLLALVLCSCGFTQVFVGNLEIYALLQLGLAAFLFVAVRYLRDESPLWAVGVVFGLFFCLHLSSGWWIPAFLLLPYVKAITTRPLAHPFREVFLQLCGFSFIVIGYWLFLLAYGYHGDLRAMQNHFWSDEVMYTGTDKAMFYPWPTYSTADYYLTQLNMYFNLMPAIWILLATVLMSVKYWRPLEPVQFWILVMAGFYGVYSIVWHNDRPYPSDWDLFSGLTVPLMLSLGFIIVKSRLSDAAKQYILYQAAVFSGLFLILQIVRNYLRVTEWPLF